MNADPHKEIVFIKLPSLVLFFHERYTDNRTSIPIDGSSQMPSSLVSQNAARKIPREMDHNHTHFESLFPLRRIPTAHENISKVRAGYIPSRITLVMVSSVQVMGLKIRMVNNPSKQIGLDSKGRMERQKNKLAPIYSRCCGNNSGKPEINAMAIQIE